VWAADAPDNAFACLVQLLFLTATRRNAAAHMRRVEVSGEEMDDSEGTTRAVSS
jgi:hypothetical protein